MPAISRLALGLGLIQLARSQKTGIEGNSVCGYVDGNADRAVDCPSGSTCGFFSVFGRANAHIGCCGEDSCAIPTTCIESGTTSNGYTLQCTGNVLPSCAVYTWSDYEAEGYYCAPYRTTETVYRETTTGDVISDPTEILTVTYKTTLPEPTSNPKDDGPSMGTEHDLNREQRIGAAVGSGISGGLLLIFFVIFGCCRWSKRKTSLPRPQIVSQAVEGKSPQAPGQADFLRPEAALNKGLISDETC